MITNKHYNMCEEEDLGGIVSVGGGGTFAVIKMCH